MKFGRLRFDDEGHEYLIPEELIEKFDKLTDDIEKIEEGSDDWYELIDEFGDNYSEFRVSNICGLRILIEE